MFPSQFTTLCKYLNDSDLAQTWFLTMPGHAKRHAADYPNLLGFQPDGQIVGPQSYYYSAKAERSARISRGLLKALKELEKHHPIDLVVCHSLFGAPQFLYDEFDAAIVSYIEFPSYRAHGWDDRFPPTEAQRLTDRNMEMLHFHQALLSDLTIVPSYFAKSMFPTELQGRIEVQFEGFQIAPPSSSPARDRPFTVGFAARDLSYVKGVDVFVEIVDRCVRDGDQTRFIAIGAEKTSTYGYESQWLESHYKDEAEKPSYLEHCIREFPSAQAIERPGKLPYDEYAQLLTEIDVFCYPLRYGVANWGLMEILARGGCVLGADHGYVPEHVNHGQNGELAPIDDIDAWVSAIRRLRDSPETRQSYARAALETGQSFDVSRVAPRYMTLFRQALDRYAHRGRKR